MLGYWNKPEATAEVIDADGFFRTGDIAEIDDDGFLLIVDRKKDIIVTAGGKNVAPQPIESHLKRSPCVDVAVLIGDRRPFITALISPNFEELERWAKARSRGRRRPRRSRRAAAHPRLSARSSTPPMRASRGTSRSSASVCCRSRCRSRADT